MLSTGTGNLLHKYHGLCSSLPGSKGRVRVDWPGMELNWNVSNNNIWQCNPMNVYSKVIPILLNGAFFQANKYRCAMCSCTCLLGSWSLGLDPMGLMSKQDSQAWAGSQPEYLRIRLHSAESSTDSHQGIWRALIATLIDNSCFIAVLVLMCWLRLVLLFCICYYNDIYWLES